MTISMLLKFYLRLIIEFKQRSTVEINNFKKTSNSNGHKKHKKIFKVSIIGAGYMAEEHIKAFKKFKK